MNFKVHIDSSASLKELAGKSIQFDGNVEKNIFINLWSYYSTLYKIQYGVIVFFWVEIKLNVII